MADQDHECRIHVNDVGTELQFQIEDCLVGQPNKPIPVAPTDTVTVTIKRGSVIFTKPAINTTVQNGGAGDGSDGKVSYFTVIGDLPKSGTYSAQATLTTPLGEWHSSIIEFNVAGNL